MSKAALSLHRDTRPSSASAAGSGWRYEHFIGQIQKWLVSEKRLIEKHSGKALVKAYFVGVHKGRAAAFPSSSS
jgi:hypothetical protein